MKADLSRQDGFDLDRVDLARHGEVCRHGHDELGRGIDAGHAELPEQEDGRGQLGQSTH